MTHLSIFCRLYFFLFCLVYLSVLSGAAQFSNVLPIDYHSTSNALTLFFRTPAAYIPLLHHVTSSSTWSTHIDLPSFHKHTHLYDEHQQQAQYIMMDKKQVNQSQGEGEGRKQIDPVTLRTEEQVMQIAIHTEPEHPVSKTKQQTFHENRI
jgi:hypothetical protein